MIAQNQLGAGVTAMGMCLTALIKKSKDDPSLTPLIGYLGDSGRILTDLHYRMSVTRRSFITLGLNMIVKNIADDCEVDSLLYGENFSEKLKSAKAAKKSGKNIVKSLPSSSSNRTTNHYNYKKRTYSREDLSKYLNYWGPPKRNHRTGRHGGGQNNKSTWNFLEGKTTLNEVSIIAGRLKLFAHNLSKLTSDKIIYQYVTGYEIPFITEPWQAEPPKEAVISYERTKAIIFQQLIHC